jgi:hypothetical protein
MGMMRSRGYINVTVGGGLVGVPLPIGGPSAILGSSMTGPDPSLFREAEGGCQNKGLPVHGPILGLT